MKLFAKYPTLFAWVTAAALLFGARPNGFHEW
jgi:hypothetical protein